MIKLILRFVDSILHLAQRHETKHKNRPEVVDALSEAIADVGKEVNDHH